MPEKNLVFSHFCDWSHCPDSMLPSCFAEFNDLGADNLVFLSGWLSRILKDPMFFGALKHAAKNRVKFTDMHAVYGECYDLACMSPARREELVRDHSLALAYASELGCRSYTIHIGAYNSVFFQTPNEVLRPCALETLEKLIPAAEKYGVVIAVENSYERSNTPDEVMYYVNAVNHPMVKCCVDCGHANMLEYHPGKDNYGSYIKNEVWWGSIEHENQAFEKMASKIVTCHLHDNDGYDDQHLPPGMGSVNWEKIADNLLNNAPELRSIQSEASIFSTGISIKDYVSRFRKIFPSLIK